MNEPKECERCHMVYDPENHNTFCPHSARLSYGYSPLERVMGELRAIMEIEEFLERIRGLS